MEKTYTSGNWRNYLLIVILIIFVNLMTFEQGLVPTNVDPIQAHFGIGEGMLGVLIGFYTVMLATMTLVFGYLSDKSRRIELMALGILIWAICAIFSYYSAMVFQNIGLFAFFRICAGVGLGCLTPVGFSLLCDIVSPGSRSKAFGVWTIASVIGAIGGALIGMSAYTAFEQTGATDAWQAPFLYIGLVGLFLVAIVILFPEPKRAASEDLMKDLLTEEGLRYSYRIKRADLKNIYARKSNFWLIINFVDCIYPGLLMLWIFDYLTESFDLTEGVLTSEVIVVLAMVALGFLLGTAFFSWLGDRKFKRGDQAARAKIAVYCAIFTTPFVVAGFIVPLSSSNYWWVGLLVSIGLGINQGIGPNWYATIIDVNIPENRGTMIATATFLDHIGRAIGQMVGGFLIAYFASTFMALQWASIFLFLQIPFWIPVLKYVKGDIQEVQDILAARAKEMKEST